MVERPDPGGAHAAGRRAAWNTAVRAAAEIVGKLASLALFAALGRVTGESGLGVYVFAFGWVQIATVPIGIGMDRYFLRRVARDRSMAREVTNVVALKLTIAIPLSLLSLALVTVLGYGGETRAAVAILTVGLLMDLLARSFFSTFNAHERNELVAASLLLQRLCAAGLGLLALAAGFGVVTVAATYTIGAALGLGSAVSLFHRRIRPLSRRIEPGRWRSLSAGSLSFGVQDMFGVLLSKIDVVLLSLLATEVAVGRYGASYRLVEATFFVTFSISSAFAAMYTYLDRDTTPSVRSVFERSIKLSLALLTPCAVALALLAEPLLTLIFGASFGGAADALRLLGPAVVLFSVVTLSGSLIVARRNPMTMAAAVAGAVALNVALNLVLIPPLAEVGAAAAMLATELVLVGVALGLATRAVGGIRWVSLASPLAAGGVMATVVALASGPSSALIAAALGALSYALVLGVLERLISPGDLRFLRDLLREGGSPKAAA